MTLETIHPILGILELLIAWFCAFMLFGGWAVILVLLFLPSDE